jgi:hypothetical protein
MMTGMGVSPFVVNNKTTSPDPTRRGPQDAILAKLLSSPRRKPSAGIGTILSQNAANLHFGYGWLSRFHRACPSTSLDKSVAMQLFGLSYSKGGEKSIGKCGKFG